MSNPDLGGSSKEAQKRPRRRPQLSCVLCKRRKVKCNRELPCDQCYKLSKGRSCTYTDILQSPDRSDQCGLTPDVPPSTVHRVTAESNTGSRPWTQNEIQPAYADRLVSHDLATYGRDAYLATPGGSPALYNTNGPARDASAKTTGSTPDNSYGAQACDNTESNVGFLGGMWAAELQGNSHWWTVFPKLPTITMLISSMTVIANNGTRQALWPYLAELREKKMLQLNADIINLGLIGHMDMKKEFQSHEHSEMLIMKYLQSFGKVYDAFLPDEIRDSFRSVWSGEDHRCDSAVALGLVFAIGNAVLKNDDPHKLPRSAAIRWFSMGKVWRNSVLEVHLYTVTSLQVDILMHLTRRLYCYGPPNDSVSSAMLVRNAMAMNLHKESSHSHKSGDERLLRRRLWRIVVELDLQSSLESGMSPAYSGSWDHDMSQEDTQGTALTILSRSLPARLKMAQLLTKTDFDMTYDTACELHEELMVTVGWSLFEDEVDARTHSEFELDYERLLIRRILLALHWPFAIQQDTRFHFSRNVCLVMASRILQQCLRHSEAGTTGTDLQHIVYAQSNIYQNDVFPAALYLSFELLRGVTIPDVANPLGRGAAFRHQARSLIDQFLGLAEERLLGSDYSEIPFVISNVMRRYICWRDSIDPGSNEAGEILQATLDEVGQQCIELMPGSSQVLC